MDLIFITDSRFAKSNNSIYNINGSLGDALWERYLEHFDNIVVVARVLHNAPDNKKAPQTTNSRVRFIELPYFIGPIQFIFKKNEIKKIIKTCISNNVAYICRVPGTIGNLFVSELRGQGIPYALEVVGDPKESLSYRATHKIIPALLSSYAAYKLRNNVYNANAVLYVTNVTLQSKYPVKLGISSFGVSDVVIETDLESKDVKEFPSNGKCELIAIGSLEQMYKSPDIVLKALEIVISRGYSFHLTWLGDGKYKKEMLSLAKELGIQEFVSFVGNVSKVDVNKYLRCSDVYVQASRTEGLPRALIEAMAVGLPCVGTKVGGIPELLSEDYLFKVDNYKQLADILCRFVTDADYVNKAKYENYNKALSFTPQILKTKRDSFFRIVKELYK